MEKAILGEFRTFRTQFLMKRFMENSVPWVLQFMRKSGHGDVTPCRIQSMGNSGSWGPPSMKTLVHAILSYWRNQSWIIGVQGVPHSIENSGHREITP